MSMSFADATYDLGGGASLVRAPDGQTLRALGARFAAIEPWSRYAMTEEGLGGYLSAREPGKIAFGIQLEHQIAGLVIVQPSWMRGPYVPFFGILPEFQGRGLGGRVLQWIGGEAARFHARNTWIAVSDFNTRARALYERQGYIAVADLADLVAEGRTEILMRKRL